MLRIAIAGASGRMGRMLIDAVRAAPDLVVSAALDQAASPAIGTRIADDTSKDDASRAELFITSDIDAALTASDVLIDFTRPEGTLVHLAACVAHRVKMVVGTTGFDDAGQAAITEAAAHIAIVFAPNMSVGVNVLFKLIEQASRALAHGYDVEIIEAHHRGKVDAPSGTALRMGEIVADATERDLEADAIFSRQGHTGARDAKTIGFSAIRGGDIVGDHTVLFAGIGERIEITHRASSRAGYAEGGLLAARYLATRDRGLFDMQDVLGLR
jgi:4-hydroxy-tetrahydrodipicolinate reductase